VDGNFLNPVAEAGGDDEDFDIIHVSIDLLQREERLGDMERKELETALGIADGEAGERAHNVPKALAADLPIEGLFLFYAGSGECSGSDDDFDAFFEPRENDFEILDGDFVVGVGEADVAAFSESDGVALGVAKHRCDASLAQVMAHLNACLERIGLRGV
jgi:hypothetical protein